MSKRDLIALTNITRDARVLSSALFRNDAASCQEAVACLQGEAGRKRSDGRPRGFSAYDPKRLCLACRAYWLAENAAQCLEGLLAWERRSQAERAPTQPPSYEEAQPTMVEAAPSASESTDIQLVLPGQSWRSQQDPNVVVHITNPCPQAAGATPTWFCQYVQGSAWGSQTLISEEVLRSEWTLVQR